MNRAYLSKIFSLIIVLLSLFFLGRGVWQCRNELIDLQFSFSLLAAFLAAALIYTISTFALAFAWQNILEIFAQESAGLRLCFSIYARTQVAKYLPGNIFHLAGRHVMGRAAGFTHRALVAASSFEILGLLICAIMVKFASELLYGRSLAIFSLIFILSISFVILFSSNLARRHIYFFSQVTARQQSILSLLLPIAYILTSYCLFFAIAGLALHTLAGQFPYYSSFAVYIQLISTFAIAWLAGFITPGAPAGLGVREAVLVILLTVTFSESDTILLVLLFRLATVLGDMIAFLLSFVVVADKAIPGS